MPNFVWNKIGPVVSAMTSDLHGRRECQKMYGTFSAMSSKLSAASTPDLFISSIGVLLTELLGDHNLETKVGNSFLDKSVLEHSA